MTRESEAVSEVESTEVAVSRRKKKISDCDKEDESLSKRRPGRPKVFHLRIVV